jgi:hypothetical protein
VIGFSAWYSHEKTQYFHDDVVSGFQQTIGGNPTPREGLEKKRRWGAGKRFSKVDTILKESVKTINKAPR